MTNSEIQGLLNDQISSDKITVYLHRLIDMGLVFKSSKRTSERNTICIYLNPLVQILWKLRKKMPKITLTLFMEDLTRDTFIRALLLAVMKDELKPYYENLVTDLKELVVSA